MGQAVREGAERGRGGRGWLVPGRECRAGTRRGRAREPWWKRRDPGGAGRAGTGESLGNEHNIGPHVKG